MNYLDEFKALPKWCAFRQEWNAEKNRIDKPPINVRTGYHARPNVLEDWVSYDDAVNYAMRQGLYSIGGGVGFLFTDGDCYAGIDLDHVIDESGNLKDFAADIVAIMDSYTELSPSGKGLHILFKLDEPLKSFCGRNRVHYGDCVIEIYDSGRYFTVSEKPYGEAKPISERTEAAKKFYKKYMKPEEKANTEPFSSVEVSSTLNWKYQPPIKGKFTNAELWQLMFENEKNGVTIRALYNGDISGYGDDQSTADLALCNHLAFWTGGDAAQMDSMFRDSELMRSKWDEKHYSTGETYGQHTIAQALSKTRNYYKPDEFYDNATVSGSVRNSHSELPQKKEKKAPVNLLAYLENSLHSDIKVFSQYKDRKTGYSNIDQFTSLYPGLYAFGAVSSLGKTTFLHQMADQLAQAGEYVLYFSLEQSQLELATKGLSRLTAQESLNYAVSSLDIRKGQSTEAINRAIAKYKKFASYETIIEGGFGTSITSITNAIEKYITTTKHVPVVIVDYLQLVVPENPKLTGKDAVDANIAAFKQLQQKYQLVLFLVSSFNRQNYLTIADFESFKESGIIEYSADVVWALQLYIMNNETFNQKENFNKKREKVREAKKAIPRWIELVVLKNRYGKSNESYYFKYDARYDLFEPSNEKAAKENTEEIKPK